MTDLRRPDHLKGVGPAVESRRLATAGRQTPPPMEVPERHVLFLIKEAAAGADEGDMQRTITNLCQAVFVAGTRGREGLTEIELLHELKQVADFGFSAPDGAA